MSESVYKVVEIIGVQRITRVPDSAPFVHGVINLRGRVIPVVDVRARFGLLDRDYDNRTCIIVVRVNATDVGLIVDTVQEVLDRIERRPKGVLSAAAAIEALDEEHARR